MRVGGLIGFLACLAVFAAGCSGPGTAQGEAEAPAERPNVIFILADNLDLASVQQMPALRSLMMEEGASFENAFVSYPVCCPSRATILTGLYAHNHGVESNKPPVGGFPKFLSEGNEEETIAVRLQEEGYRTALFGKYLNKYPGKDQAHVPPGWDEWHAKLGGHEYYDYDMNENGEVVSYGSETGDYYTDVLSEKATAFVRSAATDSRPFFAYVTPLTPHSPATPAERHEGAFAGEEAPRPPSFDEEDVSDKPAGIRALSRISDKEAARIDERYRKRLESLLAMDEMIASLIEELEATGELDDTYLFFTSDNGFLQGEHRLKHGKKLPYEEAIHMPLFVRGPGVTAGSTVEKLTLNTDFAPTFAELAGVEEFSTDGRSLAPLLRGEDPPSWRSAVLLEGFGSEVPPGYGAVRTETHKYIEYGDGETELYDPEADPYELESLHESADLSLVEDLKTRLEALRSCTGEGCVEAEDAR